MVSCGPAVVVRLLLAGLALPLLAARAEAALEACAPVVGELVSAEGEGEVQRADASSWEAAGLGAPLCQRDSVRTGARSRAAVHLVNDAVLPLIPELVGG